MGTVTGRLVKRSCPQGSSRIRSRDVNARARVVFARRPVTVPTRFPLGSHYGSHSVPGDGSHSGIAGEFAECVIFMLETDKNNMHKAESNVNDDIFLGFTLRTIDYVLGTKQSIFKCSRDGAKHSPPGRRGALDCRSTQMQTSDFQVISGHFELEFESLMVSHGMKSNNKLT